MKSTVGRIILMLVVLTATAAGGGSIYKWVDKDGTIHFSDQAPEEDLVEGDVESRQAVTDSASSGFSPGKINQRPTGTGPAAPKSARETVSVEIYATSWCRYCNDAKRYFKSRGIAIKEYDVEKDRAAAQRLKRYNPRGGVPVTVINGRAIVGYAPNAFDRALQNS